MGRRASLLKGKEEKNSRVRHGRPPGVECSILPPPSLPKKCSPTAWYTKGSTFGDPPPPPLPHLLLRALPGCPRGEGHAEAPTEGPRWAEGPTEKPPCGETQTQNLCSATRAETHSSAIATMSGCCPGRGLCTVRYDLFHLEVKFSNKCKLILFTRKCKYLK